MKPNTSYSVSSQAQRTVNGLAGRGLQVPALAEALGEGGVVIRFVKSNALSRAARVARQVSLLDVYWDDIQAKARTPFASAPEGPWKLDYKDRLGSVERTDDNKLAVIVRFVLTGSEPKSEQELLRISQVIRIRYEVLEDEEISEQDLRDFAKVNALYNAWPYAREVVQQMSTRLDYPPIVMPLLVIQPEPPTDKKRKPDKREGK